MKNFISMSKLLLSSVFHKNGWESLERSDVLVVRHDANCGYRYAGKAYSPIIDTVVEQCFYNGLSVQTIAKPFSKLTEGKAFNSPVAFNRSFLVVALLTRVLFIFIGRESSKKIAVSKKTSIWLRVLRLVRPRIVIGIQPDSGLCRACRILNIPVYDIQHGVISRSHNWYGEILPKEVPDSDLPNGFLCWDHQSACHLQNWAPNRGATVSVVGHPWFQRFQYPDDKDLLVQDAIKNGRIFSDRKPVILVSLQWGLHLHYYQDSDFNHVMCKALEVVIKRTHSKYNWLLRLHPVQIMGGEGKTCEEYLFREFGGFAGVEWRKASLAPLPVLLSQTNLHITDMSSVVIEASWFGLPSALLNPCLNKGGSLENLYEHERKSGMATVLDQEAYAIESWIDEKRTCTRSATGFGIPRNGIQSLLEKVMTTSE